MGVAVVGMGGGVVYKGPFDFRREVDGSNWS